MEQFSRECLEIDEEHQGQNKDGRSSLFAGPSMDRVYDSAAKLVKRTLDVEGVIVMDISHSEVLETMSAEGTVSVTMHHGDPGKEMTRRQLSTEEYKRLNHFFDKYPDGKISEGIIPHSFRPFLPTRIQYALSRFVLFPRTLLTKGVLAVPIFNIDKRPFALICAYSVSDQSKRFVRSRFFHSMRHINIVPAGRPRVVVSSRNRSVCFAVTMASLIQSAGVIILSAVLKRRMMLADKAKSLFISKCASLLPLFALGSQFRCQYLT
jgi:hypothetical protein